MKRTNAYYFNLLSIVTITLASLCSSMTISAQDWTASEIQSANTAANCPFLTQVEKDVILYNNLARLYPKRFIDIELRDKTETAYLLSLKRDLYAMRPTSALSVNRNSTELAKCWAEQSGLRGLTGHNRIGCSSPTGTWGENCS